MGRSPCCDGTGLKKGPWTPEEDHKLLQYIHRHGYGSWRSLPKLAGLNRCGKSCRLRWTNYLRPDIKRGKFTREEEQTILHFHSILGNKWSAISAHLPGRTDNEIKNYWNTHLKKRLIQMGLDPMTHRPKSELLATLPQLIALARIQYMLQSATTNMMIPPISSAPALPVNGDHDVQQGQAWSMPEMEIPCDIGTFEQPLDSLDLPGLSPSLPPLADVCAGNSRDAGVTASFWSDLLLQEDLLAP